MARVVFLGTPHYAVPALKALIAHHTVVAVVTQPDRFAGRGRKKLEKSPVKELAEAYGLPIFQPERLSRDTATLQALQDAQADVFVLAAFGQILRANVLSIPRRGVLGLHASLLPRWRGAAPVAAAIRAGDAETGVTIMLTDQGIDTGPILAQRALAIFPRDTCDSLTRRLADLAADLLIETLPAWLEGAITPTPQDEALATYAPMIKKSDGAIPWADSALAIDRHIRAMTSWPGAFTLWRDLRITILSAYPLPDIQHNGPPGLVIRMSGGIAVATGQGVIVLEQIQPAGKRPMAATAFVQGHPDFIGSILS